MSNTHQLVLYATSSCHLCEMAQTVIHSVLGVTVNEVDIVDDDRLMECYATRIPVLQRMDTGAEIGWPFDAEEVRLFLSRS